MNFITIINHHAYWLGDSKKTFCNAKRKKRKKKKKAH